MMQGEQQVSESVPCVLCILSLLCCQALRSALVRAQLSAAAALTIGQDGAGCCLQ